MVKPRINMLIVVLVVFLFGCSLSKLLATHPPNTTSFPGQASTLTLEASLKKTQSTEALTPIPLTLNYCYPVGTSLRIETVQTLLNAPFNSSLVVSINNDLAVSYFPALEGWVRVLNSPSLAAMQQKGTQATQQGIPYEGLGYGLETGPSTPQEEWLDIPGSVSKARTIADQFGKQLVFGPGFQLMSQNENIYPSLAAQVDIWILQTQKLQINPPGAVYRQEVERIVRMLRSGNPNIKVWAQITLPPDRPPDAQEWLAYHNAIFDLVDGTYIGVYYWGTRDTQQVLATIDAIYHAVCNEN